MIVVGTTTSAWKCDGRSELAWLDGAEELRAQVSPDPVLFLAVLEVDARGLDPFAALLDRMRGLPAVVWTYSLDDGETEITTSNRIARICMGRNLITEYAVERDAEWVLFLDSDNTITRYALEELLDVDWPIVGGLTYVMSGVRVRQRPARVWLEGNEVWPRDHEAGEEFGYPVRQHWTGAGMLLVHRCLFRRLYDAAQLGWPTLVRHDVIARPVAEAVPVEERDADRVIRR